jgi:hypothetical protein
MSQTVKFLFLYSAKASSICLCSNSPPFNTNTVTFQSKIVLASLFIVPLTSNIFCHLSVSLARSSKSQVVSGIGVGRVSGSQAVIFS